VRINYDRIGLGLPRGVVDTFARLGILTRVCRTGAAAFFPLIQKKHRRDA